MRIEEVVSKPVKPKPPMTAAQARLQSLTRQVERSRLNLSVERDRQRRQRESERQRKVQQRRAAGSLASLHSQNQ